jgi:FHA domain/FhaA, N-terminal domain
MSGPFTALERFFERIFERPAARLFGAGVEPVQVRHRLERAMDGAQRPRGGFVPDQYRVRVHPDDLGGLGDAQAGFVAALVAHARSQGYRLPRRPVVVLSGDPGVDRGDVVVDATFGAVMARAGARPSGAPGSGGAAADGQEAPPSGATVVFQVPATRVPLATLLVQSPGAAPREYPVRIASVRIGRGSDNDLVLADARVSRQHGLLSARQGGLVYTDLGSSNGSFVNAGRVREVALGPGDVLRLGDTTVTIAHDR